MTKKLLAHFKTGQNIVTEYLSQPDSSKTNDSNDRKFINDMIGFLDGPEQREAQADAEFDYLVESARTASGHYHGELVSWSSLIAALEAFQTAAQRLDRIKKLLFYGEDRKKGRFADTDIGQLKASEALHVIGGQEAEYIVHGVLGVATEAGEMVEALYKAITAEERPDLINLLEEIGDLQWYEAMLARAFGSDFDAIQRANINKLRDRFPEKFTTEAANTRDLDKERATLEAGFADAGHTVPIGSEPDWPKPVRPVSDEHKHVPAAKEE